jgi:integrase/recombinase XerD
MTKVLGKGQKERLVPLTPNALRAAHDLLSRHDQATLIPWTARGFRWLLAELGTKAGVERAHPHRWRHTYGTRLISAGIDSYVVADLLGHSDPRTTKVYARVSESRLHRAVRLGL